MKSNLGMGLPDSLIISRFVSGVSTGYPGFPVSPPPMATIFPIGFTISILELSCQYKSRFHTGKPP